MWRSGHGNFRAPSRRMILATLGVLLGLVLTVSPLWLGSTTAAACTFPGGIHGTLYELVGIYPPGFELEISWHELRICWNDGCNGHNSPLLPSLLGLALLAVAGAATYRTFAE